MVLRAGGDEEVLEANLSFHLHAGIDGIVVLDASGEGSASALLKRLPPGDRVRIAPQMIATASRSGICRWAAREHRADWLIESEWNEFWWPRAASFRDALTAVPFEFNAAQGVVRTLLPTTTDGPFEERFTMRLSPRGSSVDPRWRPDRRFAVRAEAAARDPAGIDAQWGYYPFEVLRLVATEASRASDEETRRAIDLGAVVEDRRLRDVLRQLRTGSSLQKALSSPARETLTFAAPGPVEDAVFALEAAVLNDLDLSRARRQLDELAGRVSTIERYRLVRVEAALRRARRWLRRKLVERGATP